MKFSALFIVSLIYCFIGLFNPVLASSNFSTTYDQTYRINSDGSANVNQIFTITNLSSQVLTDKSVLFLPYKDISNLSASDASGPLKTTVTQEDNGVVLSVSFNNPAAGIGQKYSWTLNFTTYDLIKKYGFNTDITIPQLELPEPITDFTVRLLLTNANFGKLSYVWPPAPLKLEWTKAALGDKNAHVIFSSADTQPYYLSLKYILRNKNLYPTTLEIPLFSNTQDQEVSIASINPKPLDVVANPSGTWLARYYLGANSSLEINSEVSLTKKINRTATPRQDSVEQIYKHIVSSFKPESTCQEETALFVQMVANLGIPARSVSGLLYPENEHLHCWAEFYDQKNNLWHSVDPKLEITTGSDYFNEWDPYHLTLSASDWESKTIGIPLSQISFKAGLERVASSSANLAYQADFPRQNFSGFNFGGKVTIINTSGVEYPNLEVIPSAQYLKPKKGKIVVGNLPPFSRRTIDVEFGPTQSWNFSGDDIISLIVDGKASSYSVKLVPFYTSPIVLLAGGVIFVFIIFTLAKISGGLLFQRRRRADPIHR